MNALDCEPAAVNTTGGAASVERPSRNGKLPLSGLAIFVIFRNASRGISTQSDGADVGSRDGYEQVLTRFAPPTPPTSARSTRQIACVSVWPLWSGSLAPEFVAHAVLIGVTWAYVDVQRSTLPSPHVYTRGLPAA